MFVPRQASRLKVKEEPSGDSREDDKKAKCQAKESKSSKGRKSEDAKTSRSESRSETATDVEQPTPKRRGRKPKVQPESEE